MGCIEIQLFHIPLQCLTGFNRNMGCIEIGQDLETLNRRGGFNRNMGCIEILPYQSGNRTPPRLIETWDVLKSLFGCKLTAFCCGLIETWDVLKCN